MEAFSNGKSVDNATDFYSLSEGGVLFVIGVKKLKKPPFRNEAAFFDTLLFLKRHRGLLQLLGNRI